MRHGRSKDPSAKADRIYAKEQGGDEIEAGGKHSRGPLDRIEVFIVLIRPQEKKY